MTKYSKTEEELWDLWAEHYDNGFLGQEDPTLTADALADMVTDNRALELGIGTGRVAIPLAKKGIAVEGIELSSKMAEILRLKAASLPITVTLGDMADVPTKERFSLIYVVYSGFLLLQAQEAQVRCFRNVARTLNPGGSFVVEATHPQAFGALVKGRELIIRNLSDKHLSLSATIVDPVAQKVNFQELNIDDKGIRLLPCHIRYAWPAEIDLMAQMAGLTLVSRTENWIGDPLTSASSRHVSIYRA